jgi:hypothetical protein
VSQGAEFEFDSVYADTVKGIDAVEGLDFCVFVVVANPLLINVDYLMCSAAERGEGEVTHWILCYFIGSLTGLKRA